MLPKGFAGTPGVAEALQAGACAAAPASRAAALIGIGLGSRRCSPGKSIHRMSADTAYVASPSRNAAKWCLACAGFAHPRLTISSLDLLPHFFVVVDLGFDSLGLLFRIARLAHLVRKFCISSQQRRHRFVKSHAFLFVIFQFAPISAVGLRGSTRTLRNTSSC
jgi:hypothetical protein